MWLELSLKGVAADFRIRCASGAVVFQDGSSWSNCAKKRLCERRCKAVWRRLLPTASICAFYCYSYFAGIFLGKASFPMRLYIILKSIGSLQPISSDRDGNAAMYTCGWTNKRSQLEIFCFRPPTWRLWRNVKTANRVKFQSHQSICISSPGKWFMFLADLPLTCTKCRYKCLW